MDQLEQLRAQYNPQIKAAFDAAVERGEIKPEQVAELKKWYGEDRYYIGNFQGLYRRGCMFPASGPRDKYDTNECMTAILDALLNQGSMIVWCGDGTSCVEQMIETAYHDRDYWRNRALRAEKRLDNILEAGVSNHVRANAQGHTGQVESD